MSSGLKTILIILAVIAVFALLTIFWGMGQYNKVVSMDEQVKSQWAQVENQLKRRYDLIPNLVETVKGYAKHEKDIFENIANARTKYFQAQTVKDKIQASQQLEGTLFLLFVHGQDQHLDGRVGLLNLPGGFDPRQRRHGDIQDHHIHRQAFEQFQQLEAIPHLSYDQQTRQRFNDFLNPLAHQDVIFGQDNFIHNYFPCLSVGMENVMVVPRPLRLEI